MKPFLYTSKEKKAINTLLSRAAEPDEAMNAEEFHGFCCGLAMLPEIIRMQEWMPVAFGEEQLVFEGQSDAQKLMGDLVALRNRLNGMRNDGTILFPFDFSSESSWTLEQIEDWTGGFYEALSLRPEVMRFDDAGFDEAYSSEETREVMMSLVFIKNGQKTPRL